MKVVNQGTGKDLDPNNVIIEQEERRRRSFQDYTGQKITLEAVLNTTCKKCGCKGHFAKDCFMQPGGTKYSLIPEEEEEKEETKEEGLEKPDPTKNSSRKRKKRRKRNTETGSHLTVIALTLRVTQARRRGIHQKTARLPRRKRRRRNTRRSTRNEGGIGRSSPGSCKDSLVTMWPPTPLTCPYGFRWLFLMLQADWGATGQLPTCFPLVAPDPFATHPCSHCIQPCLHSAEGPSPAPTATA